MSSQQALAALDVPKDGPGLLSDFMALTKARLSMLVLITTFVGFCMATAGPIDWFLLFNTLLGTALVAASAAVFNQAVEMNVDRLMERTRNRPLPGGRMKQETAFALGGCMAVGGLAWLMLTVNLVTVLLAALTLGIYILIYTPLKRRTSFCVAVGAVSGAIPPVIGWSAVNPKASEGALILFGVLFLWQMPHFLSIAWMYRDQYAQAGFRMVRKSDASGANTAASAFLFSLGLVGVATAPAFLGMTSYVYLAGAMLLNAVLLLCAVQFCMERTRPVARRLFFSSILYLPLLLGLMVFTKN